MTVFVDTSALYAVLDADDQDHERAKQMWIDLLAHDVDMVCTNYVLVETFALVQRRLGMEAASVLQEDMVPVLRIVWVDEACHRASVSALLTAARRQLSLVDCVSFDTMRHLGVKRVFAFDSDFAEQGFQCVP